MFAAEAGSRDRFACRRRRSLQASRPCLKSAVRTRRERKPAPPWERPQREERSVVASSRALRRVPRIDRILKDRLGSVGMSASADGAVGGHGGAL